MRRIILFLFLCFILTPFLWLALARPPRSNSTDTLYQGITYTREARAEPRPIMLHIVEIDLTAPGLGFFVTPPETDGSYRGRTTRTFLTEFDLQLAINANFYQATFRDPAALYPISEVISEGTQHVASQPSWSALCLQANHQALITASACPAGTMNAVAGNVILVDGGQPLDLTALNFPGRRNRMELAPRTVVATDETGTRLWLIVVDGRQGNYSEGLTLPEMAELVAGLGVYRALNLDGGGSSTLVVDGWLRPRTLNSPIHSRIPTRQREIPVHLGIYALPLE